MPEAVMKQARKERSDLQSRHSAYFAILNCYVIAVQLRVATRRTSERVNVIVEAKNM